jgi:hypothetical protein
MPPEPRPIPHSGDLEVYEIRVQGRLDPAWSDRFGGMSVTASGEHTLISGPIDQAALHGSMRVIRDLGLRLVSVRLVDRR